jgi:hypothetical protein
LPSLFPSERSNDRPEEKQRVGFVDAIKLSDEASITFKCRYFKLHPLVAPSVSKTDTRSFAQPIFKGQHHNDVSYDRVEK